MASPQVGIAVGAQSPEKNGPPSWLYMILIAVTLTVAAIPEGLPLTVTISLSTGCSDMVKEHVLMRKIAAVRERRGAFLGARRARGPVASARSQVETLGSASIICTDKTGTLTEGKMRCVKLYAAETDYARGRV